MDFLDLIGFQKRTPRSSPIDVRTNPGTYLDISRGVDETLQRRVPTSFRGAGIQNAPMNVLGQVSDISRMPPGPAREAARSQLQRNLQMADRLNNAGTPRPFGQGASGSLRAPGIGAGGSNAPGMTFNPNTRLPGGGPFQRDYGMTREAMRAVKGAGSVAQGLKGLAQGGATAGLGYALDLAAPTLAEEAIRGLSTITGGVSTPTWLKSVNGTNYDIRTDSGMKAYKEATGRGGDNKIPTAASKQNTGAWTINGWDPSAKRPALTSDTPPPAPELPPPPPELPPPPPSNNLPPSPDQSMMDPYAYNLAVYGQGRNLATTKDERAAVRDLGLAINRKIYDQKFNKTQDINPLLQATFPERYNSTLTGNIESRGTTLPGSMTEADSGSELATAQVQDTPYQAQFMRGMQEAQIADANRMVEQLLGQAQVDEIRRRLGM
jgi:hypothetical protein